jgi:peptide deformylase
MAEINELYPHSTRREIIIYPDPVLKQKAKPVEDFNEELKTLANDMLFTMYQAPGIGLAGPQIGVDKRIFVLDVDFNRSEKNNSDGNNVYDYSETKPKVFINPVFKAVGKEKEKNQEGCLSLPGIYDDVVRFKEIEVEYQDIEGNKHQMNANGLLAVCIQHETDHLDGIMFIDRLSQLKKNFYRKKFQKLKKK